MSPSERSRSFRCVHVDVPLAADEVPYDGDGLTNPAVGAGRGHDRKGPALREQVNGVGPAREWMGHHHTEEARDDSPRLPCNPWKRSEATLAQAGRVRVWVCQLR